LEVYLDASFENIPIEEIAYDKIPIGKTNFCENQINHHFKKIEVGGAVRSFCFGLILSPPLAVIAKNKDLESSHYFLPHWYKQI
jgi:hypothetical protein